MERRLAAILAADMVGYSRLMAADEAGTLARQKAHRKELIDPKIAEYGGRVVKSTGDGVLVEFPSVVDALRCAVTIQFAIPEREAAVSEENRIAYRIGINLGDIIVEEDDIYGDGVNVAARLEALAQPGGICVSRTVVNHVKGKVASQFEDQGEQEVKNIPGPVHVFRVLMEPEEAGEATAEVERAKRWKRPVAAMAALGIVLVIMTAGIMVWRPWAPDLEPASVERMDFPLPDRPSIAVLPFTNMSDDPSQEYFADGMAEDLITDLSKISGLFVIARNSTFIYKDKPITIREVAEQLGVRYVLEGSVRRAGDQVRINAQLIDAVTGSHLWADRYDGTLADIFALQDKVTRKIVAALAMKLPTDEPDQVARRETDKPKAYDAFLLGWAHYRRRTPEDFATAVSYFERAIELDPHYSRAYAALGATYWMTWLRGWDESLGIQSMFGAWDRADEYLDTAMKKPVALAHQVKSAMAYTGTKHKEAIDEAERALSIDPNDPDSYIAMADALIFAGRAEEAVDFAEKAIRLDPQHPTFYYAVLGLARYGLGQFDKAAALLKRAVSFNPEICSRGKGGHLIPLIAAYGQLGRVQEAKEAIAEVDRVRECGPYTLKDAVGWWPYKEEADLIRLVEGLRKAGVPE